MNHTAIFTTGYMDRAWRDPAIIIDEARYALRGIKYDTLVGTGMSGAIVVPILARALRKKLLIVRKPEDHASSHASQPWLGQLGQRWVFVDDFISSGATYGRTRDAVDAALESANLWRWAKQPRYTTTLVGVFEYNVARFTSWTGAA